MAEQDDRYQMLWDCPACDTRGLLGLDHKFCPACGSPQDPKLLYFPSDAQKIAVEDHPFAGADRICPACESPNAAGSDFCQACGSPLDDARVASVREDRVVDADTADEGETGKDAREAARQAHLDEEQRRKATMAGQDPSEGRKTGGMGWVATGCLAVVGLGVVAVLVFVVFSFLFASTDDLSVTGHTWKRAITVEAFGPVEKKAWKDEVPSTATVKRCRQAVRDTKKVKDGEDCTIRKKALGDGTFKEIEECEPTWRKQDVMGDKCTYTVNDWTVTRTEQAAGRDRSPEWPTLDLRRTGKTVGAEREGERKATYTLSLEDSEGQAHTCELPETTWAGFDPGQTVQASFGGLTGAIDCRSLK